MDRRVRSRNLSHIISIAHIPETLQPSKWKRFSALHGHALDPVGGQVVLLEHGPGAGRAVVAQEVARVRDGDDHVPDVLAYFV